MQEENNLTKEERDRATALYQLWLQRYDEEFTPAYKQLPDKTIEYFFLKRIKHYHIGTEIWVVNVAVRTDTWEPIACCIKKVEK